MDRKLLDIINLWGIVRGRTASPILQHQTWRFLSVGLCAALPIVSTTWREAATHSHHTLRGRPLDLTIVSYKNNTMTKAECHAPRQPGLALMDAGNILSYKSHGEVAG